MGKEVDKKKTCFVITPIGDNNSEIRRHIDGIIDQAIVPALEGKYEIEVAHRKYEIGSINDRVIKSVFDSDLVIANLTNLNPNVMFELAIRYSFGKPAIVIALEGTKLPFDIVDENTLFYVNDPAGANELKEKIIEFENNINYTKQTYGPVYKAISKIPLYNEVESGKDVSNETMLSYIIDRLDSIQLSINNSEQRRSIEDEKSEQIIEIVFDSKSIADMEAFDKELGEILEYYDIERGNVVFDKNKIRIHFYGGIRKINHLCGDLDTLMQRYCAIDHKIKVSHLLKL